jgi:hypothetical protein
MNGPPERFASLMRGIVQTLIVQTQHNGALHGCGAPLYFPILCGAATLRGARARYAPTRANSGRLSKRLSTRLCVRRESRRASARATTAGGMLLGRTLPI